MRLLIRLQHHPDAQFAVGIVRPHVPELSAEIERRLALPQLQHQVHPFQGHQALGAGVGQVEQLPVGRHAALPEADVDAPARQVVQERQPHRYVDRMVMGDDRHAGTQADGRSTRQQVGDEQVVGRDRLPRHRVVLSDPRLGEAERLRPHHLLDVFVEARGAVLGRRVQRHHEHAQLHGGQYTSDPGTFKPLPQAVAGTRAQACRPGTEPCLAAQAGPPGAVAISPSMQVRSWARAAAPPVRA